MPEQAVRPSGRLVFHVRPAWAILIQFLRTTDNTTHVDEVLRAMDDLVRAGKVLYLGISDTPAWQASRMQAIADLRGWSPFVAMQMEYNLVERTVDRDLIPMAREMGMGIVVWSPLANGLLTGKYSASDLKKSTRAELTGTRKDVIASHANLNDSTGLILDELKAVAQEVGGAGRPGLGEIQRGGRVHLAGRAGKPTAQGQPGCSRNDVEHRSARAAQCAERDRGGIPA